MPIKSVFGGWGRPVEAKTAAYTVTASDCGKIFTNRGAAGSVTFTLPVVSSELNGWWAEFYVVASQAIVLASNPVDTLGVHNDLAADTVTSAGTPGQHFQVFCDGTQMLVVSNPSAASAATAVTAVTIAT
jgi:hypothetical protein